MYNEPAGREDVGRPRGLLRGRHWLVACVALLAAAGLLLWLALPNAAFVLGALGVSAWFFDERTRLKRKHDLVRLSGRNWVPRSELDEADSADDADYLGEAEADEANESGGGNDH
jgi:hypothetical protein